jgi:GNAT superfamily N-acetyltransferase
MKINICRAKKSDFGDIIRLINELAHFEQLNPPNKAAKSRLIRDAFGKNPKFSVLLAKSGKKIVAYAFYFFTYSSFLAKQTLYLEDIFVNEHYRELGIGKMLFYKLKSIAKNKKCGRMEWCVLNWNKNAIDFYDKLGAKPLNQWIYYRLNL